MPTRRLIRDVSRVNKSSIFLIGMMSGFIVSPLKAGITDAPFGVFIAHLFLSGVIAFAYGIVLRSARRSGPGVGFQISIFHWCVAGIGIGLLPNRPDLSFFMAGNGTWSFIQFAMMHFLYGTLVGTLFDRCAIRAEYPEPLNEPHHTIAD
ncbi:MAG TPA: hypothetical protein VM432_05575 [Bdellovibrionales bacterium]|nr:hypothetical protein [Bdellovibrionales bacterium]